MNVLERDKWLTLGTKVMKLQVLTEGPQFDEQVLARRTGPHSMLFLK
jgi:hypothetical protein